MTIELYIQGQRVELFKDESITITESIQNVKDIEKVFTAFTQSFSVPASKTNNKIFEHYYNFDIDGFDGRKKVAATIELNSIPFQTGKIKLEGVDMKNNKANTYRITFFGDIVDLKDKLGEKKLSDLDFTAYQPLNYDAATVEAKLTTEESSSNHIIAPLITHSQRLFYEDGTHGEDTGNLWFESGGGTSHHHGVKWNELKYAIRVNKIIEQIETDFDLQFSNDFFKNTSIEEFDHLFLWLHRKSGAVEDLSGSTSTFETIVDGWTPVTVSGSAFGKSATFTLTETTLTSDVATFGTTGSSATEQGLGIFNVALTTSDTDAYDIALLRDGTNVFNKTGHTGDITISGNPSATNTFIYAAGTYELVITSTSQISFTNIIWNCRYYLAKSADVIIDSSNGATGAYNTNSSFTFNINKQIPDMKILDFLTGLFKTFNLTAFVQNDVIQVKPLNDFYTGTNTYDITEFVDVNSSKVDAALPFKEVRFKFKDTKTFLANKFSELNNRTWGEIFYNEGQDLAQKEYKIEVPFAHLLYERLTDVTSGSLKNIQWGYSVDSNQSPYLGSPLLFYPIGIFSSSIDPISFVDDVNTNNVAISHKALSDVFVNMPFNTVTTLGIFNAFQLNFNTEISEWSGNTDHDQSIFVKYYQNYIKSVFNTKQRLTKLKAYLPMRILLNYGLGDRFIVAGNQYKINSISTNLLTGESNIELLNDL